MMTPVQQAPQRNQDDRGNFLRSLMAMVIVGGLLFVGIFFYIRASDSNIKLQEQTKAQLEALGREIWKTRGMANLGTATEQQQKDLEDLPRIFNAAHTLATQKGTVPIISVIDGDPPPGRGNANHQIHYFFNDTLNIILHIYVDGKSGEILFVGVHNRLVPERSLEEENKAASGDKSGSLPASSLPSPTPAPGSTLDAQPPSPLPPASSLPPAAPSPADNANPSPATPPSAEKVSEPPAIPR